MYSLIFMRGWYDLDGFTLRWMQTEMACVFLVVVLGFLADIYGVDTVGIVPRWV